MFTLLSYKTRLFIWKRVNPSFDNSWSFIVFTFPTHCLKTEAQCCDMLCCSLFLFPQNTILWRVFRFWMCGIGVIFHLFGKTFSKIKRKWFEWCIELILWDTFFSPQCRLIEIEEIGFTRYWPDSNLLFVRGYTNIFQQLK